MTMQITPQIKTSLPLIQSRPMVMSIQNVSKQYNNTNDYFGANSDGSIGIFIPLSLSLIVMAFIGRARQIRN